VLSCSISLAARAGPQDFFPNSCQNIVTQFCFLTICPALYLATFATASAILLAH